MNFSYYLRGIMYKSRQSMDNALVPFGITGQQARLVGIINSHSGERLNQKELEKYTGLTGPSITSLLNGLEKRGFLLRLVSDSDARAKELHLTDKGRELVQKFEAIFAQTDEELTKNMTDKEKKVFMSLLKRAAANMGVPSPEKRRGGADE